jgi:hypothetical protein
VFYSILEMSQPWCHSLAELGLEYNPIHAHREGILYFIFWSAVISSNQIHPLITTCSSFRSRLKYYFSSSPLHEKTTGPWFNRALYLSFSVLQKSARFSYWFPWLDSKFYEDGYWACPTRCCFPTYGLVYISNLGNSSWLNECSLVGENSITM